MIAQSSISRAKAFNSWEHLSLLFLLILRATANV